MTNILKRGQGYYARLTIPQDRWADVGKAMGAKAGLKRELVRTLETRDRREALRRRDAAIEAMRADVDAALRRARLKPLSDWTAAWEVRAAERREQMRRGVSEVVGHYARRCPATGEEIEEPVTGADLLAPAVEREAEEVERRRGADARRQFLRIVHTPGLSIAEAARQWLEGEGATVRAGTIVSHRAALAKLGAYLTEHEGLPSLEAASLSDVTRRTAGEFLQVRRAASAAGTVLREFSAYSGLWRWAVRRGYVDENPWTDQTKGMKAPRGAEAERAPERGFTPAELVELLRAERDELAPARGGYAPVFWDLFRLALLTGARADELLSLRVVDVIEDGTAIAVAAGRKGGKTESASRIIPLVPHARDVLRQRLADLTDRAPDAPLWPEVPAQGADRRRSKTVATRFPDIRRRLLGPSDEVDFHSFRRSFLTAAESAMHAGGRVNEAMIALLAGHKRGGLALDLYSDWARLGRRKLGGALAERLTTLQAAMDDIVGLGLAPEVRAALDATAGSRPPVVRTAPAFRRSPALIPPPPRRGAGADA